MTSGACGPVLPLLALIASTSSAEPASGVSSLTVRPYFALKPSISLAVVAPVMRQRDGGELAFLLGRRHQVVHRGRHIRRAGHGGERQHRYRNHSRPFGFHLSSPLVNPKKLENRPGIRSRTLLLAPLLDTSVSHYPNWLAASRAPGELNRRLPKRQRASCGRRPSVACHLMPAKHVVSHHPSRQAARAALTGLTHSPAGSKTSRRRSS